MLPLFILLSYLLITLFSTNLYAADPVLRFSNFTDGPDTGLNDDTTGSGTIVTIWGQNLGASQGTSKVYFTDSEATKREASYVYYWGTSDGSNSPSEHSVQKMQEISFSIPDSALGAGTMTVEVEGVVSNTLPFYTRASGSCYYIDIAVNGGSDSNDGSWASPWLTGEHAMGEVSAGDIVYVCDGVDRRDDSGDYGINLSGCAGTANNMTGLCGYPLANATFAGSDRGVRNTAEDYMMISNLNILVGDDGSVSSACVEGSAYGRFVGLRLSNITGETPTGQQAAFVANNLSGADEVSAVKFIGNFIDGFGEVGTNRQEHTTYFSNRSGSGDVATAVPAPEVAWNYLKNCLADSGLHFYDENNDDPETDGTGDYTGTLKIHHNYVENQRATGVNLNIGGTGVDPVTGWTMDTQIYSNIFISTGLGPEHTDGVAKYAAIQLAGAKNESAIKVYNNTFIGYGDDGEILGTPAFNACLTAELFGGTIDWCNNIVQDTQDLAYYNTNDWSDTSITGHSNNIWYNGGDSTPASAPSWDTSPSASDPDLNTDYSLKSTSPGLNTGYDTSAIVGTLDIYGIPWGTMDIGAVSLSGVTAGTSFAGVGSRQVGGSGSTVIGN